MNLDGVIASVASPPGRSARGIVRLSGDGTFDLLAPHLEFTDDAGAGWTRGLHRACLNILPGALPCLAAVLPGPRSYTGQHSVELQLPGNPALLQRVLDAVLDSARRRGIDARRAEPGAFTARAYLTGRLGLTEAEGVAATIAARSDAELRAARLLSRGDLGAFARETADNLAGALALVEAGIDFTDQENVIPIAPRDLRARLECLGAAVAAHLEHAVGSEALEAIPWVVLTGPPNAGKSTLYNALLGRARAVISAEPGTTRDVLAEPLTLDTAQGPAEVMLVDVAGGDLDAGALNQRMQEHAREARARAEMIIACTPADQPEIATSPGALNVRTKIDLDPGGPPPPGDAHVSATTGAGLDALRRLIAERLADRAVSLAADAVVLRPRHEAALRAALANLRAAQDLLLPRRHERTLAEPELIAAALRAALDALGDLAGDSTPDDVLGRIFASFCVGK